MNVVRTSWRLRAAALLALTVLPWSIRAQPPGAPVLPPPCDSVPGYHALDFWLGDWDVSVGTTVVGRDRVERILSGCGVAEHWRSARGDEGYSLFYHDPAAGTWTQVWITGRSTMPGGLKVKHLVHTFADGGVRFQGTVTPMGGPPYLDRTTLRPLPDRTVRQIIDISRDTGRTWEVRFDAVYRPHGGPNPPDGENDSVLQHVTIEVGELVFDALAAGPAGGPLVILLHGFPQTGMAFAAQLRALGKAGFRAVAPDQRGYSPGARPDAREAYVMGNFVSDVVGIAAALGYDRFHLVGHDWGGAVAWVTALRHSERVSTLSVLSTPHFAALAAQRAESTSDQAGRSSYFRRFGAPGAELWMLADDMAVLRQVLAGVPAPQRETYLRRFADPATLRAALAWYHVFAPSPTPASVPRPSAPAPAPPIQVPTLYVWGALDQSFGRAAAEATREHVAGPYTFHVLDDVGHWIPETAPDTVTQLLLAHMRSSTGRARGAK